MPRASRPTTNSPACLASRSARTRLVTCATGRRAAVPADVRQAAAVTPAARRAGTTRPCAPNATAERISGPEVARVGDAVERDEKRGAEASSASGQQVGEVEVAERRHLRGNALVRQAAGHAVQLSPTDLQQGDTAVAGEPNRLGDPLVGLDANGDVQRGHGHFGSQRLGHRIAPHQQLRRVRSSSPSASSPGVP